MVVVVETATKPSRFVHFWQGAQSLAPAARNDMRTSKSSVPVSFLHFWLRHVLRAATACTFSTSPLPKAFRTWGVLHILTWKCASRRNGEHCFDISTSKGAPNLVCFAHFDFEMCFALPWRASFISLLARWLRTRRFSEPTFRSSGATNHWQKHNVSWLCYLFAHLHLLSSHSFSSLIFSLLPFSSLTLPTSAFPSVHIVGSLTSKLPSIMFDLQIDDLYWFI